jgi:hypothetical protein
MEENRMSIFRAIAARYSKQCETRENHDDKDLQTRYYKGSFHQLFQAAEEIFQEDKDCRIKSISKEHGEIAVEISRIPSFLIVTIVNVKPNETAVDMTVSTDKISLTGINPRLKAEIIHYYQQFDRKFTYLGSAKNA